MFDQDTRNAAVAVLELCKARKLMVATAESCTGGLVAAALTEIAGSSAVVERGFVTYSNEAKQQMLGVSAATLQAYGAVSRATAEEMARGALERSRAVIAVSITGIAGPGGGSNDKPVGLVHLAAASKAGRLDHHEARFGDLGRGEIRRLSVLQALRMLAALASR